MMSGSSNIRLIVNADGYGFTPGVNRGIEEVLPAGIVRSLSCTPNFGFLGDLPALVESYPEVSVGVHVNLTVGKPVLDPAAIPTVVDEDGTFYGGELVGRIMTGRVSYADMLREVNAQVRVFTDMGIAPTHIDGHQNRHLYPGYFRAVLNAAAESGTRGLRCHRRILWGRDGRLGVRQLGAYYLRHPVRALSHSAGRIRMAQARRKGMRMADGLITPGYADSSHKSQDAFWSSLVRELQPGTWEVYCHPAYVDDLLRANASYVEPREAERVVLSSAALRQSMEAAGATLISFHDVVGERRGIQ